MSSQKLYKVLSPSGESQNGGTLKWSLPDGNNPGEWHEVARISICQAGLHLTTSPVDWWKPNCRVFEVEAEEFQTSSDDSVLFKGDKCVAKRVRLLRELTQEELVGVGVIRSGAHEVLTGRVVAKGSAQVTACGSAQVTARDGAKVTACGQSNVSIPYSEYGYKCSVELSEDACLVDRRKNGKPEFKTASVTESTS